MRVFNMNGRQYWVAVTLLAACLLQACAPSTGGLPTATATPPATTVPQPTATAFARPATPVFGAFDAARVAGLSLGDYPVVPAISATARAIYAAGVARGS